MDIGVLMSADFETKYAEVTINTDDAHSEYNGYIAVRFNPDGAKYQFFAEAYYISISNDIISLLNREDMNEYHPQVNFPKTYNSQNVRFDDWTISVELASIKDTIFGPDIVQIVKKYEKEYDAKVG
ncbi:MAG TPA: hypothetical protein DDY18_06135 [Flavobacterium sp.]|jgi:hypothetical protein|nr:hypothetical protein [Flavobacterium sp.]